MTSKHLIVILAAASTAQGCTDLETLHASYSTREEAVQQGAIERGWIPEWIPPSAKNIREVHNLDTNLVIVRFDLSEWNPKDILKHCKSVKGKEAPMPPAHLAGQIAWWRLPPDALYFYCAEPDPRWLAVGSGKGLIWNN